MKTRKIAYYLRNSTDNQEYLYQKDSLDNVLNTRNDVELVKVYGEKISGFKSETERPEMNKLLKSVDAGELTDIWVNEITRLSRASINLQTICLYCAERNVNIFFKSQNLNTLDDDGNFNPIAKLIISILAQFAEMDAKNFKQKGIQGKESKAKLGNYTGGVIPIGYTYINNLDRKTKKIIIDSERRKVVEYIFNSYVYDNKSLGQITNDLNNLKLINPNFQSAFQYAEKEMNIIKGEQWHQTTVKRVINCTWYSEGFRMYKNEKIILDNSLVFIDSNLYNMANEKLKTNQHSGKERLHTYLFKDLIFCSCGQRMQPKQATKKYIGDDKNIIIGNYECTSNHNRRWNKNEKCEHNSKSIKTESIENAVWLLIKNKLPEFRQSIEDITVKQEIIYSKIDHNNQLIEAIEGTTILELNNSRKRVIYNNNKFGGDENELEQTINEIDNQIKQQQKIITQLKSENTKHSFSIENLDVTSEIEKNIKTIELDKNLIKFYIQKLIKKITIGGGLKGQLVNVIEIEWNDTVNNNNNTFLFYYSKPTINPNFYYISSEAKNLNPASKSIIEINWSTENKAFNIFDSETNETIELTVNQMMNNLDKIDYFFNDDSKYDETMNFLIHFVNYDFYDKKENLIPKRDLINYDIDLLKRKFNFNNNAGVAKLEIVTPFV